MITSSNELRAHIEDITDWAIRTVSEEFVDMWGIDNPEAFGDAVLHFIYTDAAEEYFGPLGIGVIGDISEMFDDEMMDYVLTEAESRF